MIIPHLTYRTNLLITAPKIPTELLWDISFISIGLAVIYLIAIFYFKKKIANNQVKVRQRKLELSPMISEFLFLEDDASKDERSNYLHLKVEIRQLIKDKFNRQVLSEILMDLRKDLAGEAQEPLLKLYQDLELHKDAYVKLKSWRWQIISQGILELTQMRVEESYTFISKFINDKRDTIRKQAEIATVTLKPEGLTYFLDTTRYRISEWQQLKLLDVIRHKENFHAPRFKVWLTSNNKHVVLFSLRLIKYYNQNDTKQSLIELVKHKNNHIKEEAISCIQKFHFKEALETLKLIFWKCNVDVKIAILEAIAKMGSENDISFLQLIDKKEANYAVKSKAVSSINTIAPESVMPSNGILDTSGYKIPEDITEKVAKIHAEEHLKLSGDYLDEEHIALEAIDDLEVVSKEVKTPNRNKKSLKSDIEPVKISNADTSELSKLLQIEVDFEIIKGTQTENDIDENELADEDLKFDFLPLVVEKANEEENAVTNNVMADNSSKEKQDLDLDELAFLPFVVDNNDKDVKLEEDEIPEITNIKELPITFEEITAPTTIEQEEVELENSYREVTNFLGLDQYVSDALLTIPVVFEVIAPEPKKQVLQEIEVVEPFIFETESNTQKAMFEESNTESEKDAVTPKNTDAIASSNDSKIAFNEEWTSIDFDLNQDESDLNELEEIIPNAIIPKPLFGDLEFASSTRQLLHQIEELGDQREIPLLYDFAKDVKYESFHDRINNLIENLEIEVNRDTTATEDLKPFSVFQDLCRNCDTESKLILLDEVVAVGDEKDLEFLENLLNADEKSIREKAKIVLDELKLKLKIPIENKVSASNTNALDQETDLGVVMNEMKIETTHHSDMFELNFEFTEDIDKLESSDTLINQFYSFSNKILERFNG